ncbi:MAG TPA: hypothetical protein VJ251_22225, partial [Stellaceae bacterium]|nr:hypothetical protein [Stellaceae bacterium]
MSHIDRIRPHPSKALQRGVLTGDTTGHAGHAQSHRLECDLPPDENGNPRKLEAATHPPGYGDPERLEPLPGHGFSNYERIFTRRAEGGSSPEPMKKHGMSMADIVALMDRA